MCCIVIRSTFDAADRHASTPLPSHPTQSRVAEEPLENLAAGMPESHDELPETDKSFSGDGFQVTYMQDEEKRER